MSARVRQALRDARAGDDYVQAAEVLDGLAHRILQALQVADVGLDADRDPLAPEPLGLRGHGVVVEVQENEVGRANAQRVGERAAKAAGRAGDGDRATG